MLQLRVAEQHADMRIEGHLGRIAPPPPASLVSAVAPRPHPWRRGVT
ncbi:Hypothetical protein CAP_2746 [Chondromyces apiculatus DSM 436]|uniref:Uncharacterized protein n=1 Tax=Chondromyces apiculatus DSM 436 TaxID=1192034 RepID=A0A017TJ68_9BACT|nr:Hypothetical protein CAP_2746 [Chondromyces apiculatus DSM 436]